MDDGKIRAALDLHWIASDRNDLEAEHDIYREDAVLEYPQSGERIRGRRDIQSSRTAQPNRKRFTVRRVVGSGDLWITEFVLTYDERIGSVPSTGKPGSMRTSKLRASAATASTSPYENGGRSKSIVKTLQNRRRAAGHQDRRRVAFEQKRRPGSIDGQLVEILERDHVTAMLTEAVAAGGKNSVAASLRSAAIARCTPGPASSPSGTAP